MDGLEDRRKIIMAARPYFTGNYGSALARVDTRPIIEAGQAQGAMYAQAGKDIGGMIKEYGLNKQKREEMTNEVESAIKLNPDYLTRMTSTGIEADDKKAQTRIDKLAKGDLKLSELKGLAGELAMMEKQDLKEQAEQTRLLAQRSALLNQQLTSENIAGKKRERKAAGEKDVFRDNYFTGLNKDLDEALDFQKSDPNATLEPYFAKLVANQNMVRNKQGDLSFYQSDPTEDELKKIEKASANLGLTKTKQDIELGQIDIGQKKVESKGGKYFTIDDVSAELARLADEGTTANAVRHKSGKGFTLTNVQAVKKQKLTEFDPTNHPGIYSDINNNLYKKDKNGNPVSLGGDKTAQAQGQRLDFLRIKQRQVNDGYLIYKENGELVVKNDYLPDGEPDENTDPNDLYYVYDGEYRKYNQDEEDLINDVEILTELIGSELDFDLDVTP